MFSKEEVLSFINDNDVRFIKLVFCDIFGEQKNISILDTEIESAFTDGIPFDPSAINGFGHDVPGDLYLVPDPATLCVLPWRPSESGVVRMLCNIYDRNGDPFVADGRLILSEAVKSLTETDTGCHIGAESEFYLFNMDESGEPTVPLDNGSYMDAAPLDKGENVRRDICLALSEMGIHPERSYHEAGPGQNEIDFRYADPLTTADNMITYKNIVKNIAKKHGLFASFDPKPLKDHSGSGMHINVIPFSLDIEGDRNVFEPFLAGILNRIREITVFYNTSRDSYSRFGMYKAPGDISWTDSDRSSLIRVPLTKGERRSIELRSPDASANPYLAYTLLIYAGLEGIRNDMKLTPSGDIDNKAKLPQTYEEAVNLMLDSSFVRDHLPECIIEAYRNLK